MEKKNQLIFELEGKKITVEKFEKAFNSFLDMIDEISIQVTKKKKPFFWYISVNRGSISLNLIPEVKKEEDVQNIPIVLKSIEEGIDIINLQEQRPAHYSDEALKALRNLASIIEPNEKGINHIRVIINGSKKELKTKAIGNIDVILKTSKEEIGSIEGKLHVISDRKGLHVMVYDVLNERPIRCNFDPDLLDEILGAFGKRVYVFGSIKYIEEGKPQSIEIKNIRIFPEKDKLTKAKEVRGILRG